MGNEHVSFIKIFVVAAVVSVVTDNLAASGEAWRRALRMRRRQFGPRRIRQEEIRSSL